MLFRSYYDKLYGTRIGYKRLPDFWEVPQWMGEAANQFPGKADAYVVRDMDEARQFLRTSGYGKIAFSALDVNKPLIKDLAKEFPGRVIVGGYGITSETFKDNPNIKVYDTMKDMAKGEGVSYKPGSDLNMFKGSEVIPRLCLSKGCLHKCVFCVVPKGITKIGRAHV